MLLSSLYALVHSCSVACSSGLNIGWWLLIGCVTLNVLPAFRVLEYWHWQYFAAAFGLLYTWIMNLRHWGQTPRFGTYVNMFKQVLKRTTIALITFVSIFFGFVFGFTIFFPTSVQFKNISTASIHLFLLMLGRHEYGQILKPSDPSLSVESAEYWTEAGANLYYVLFIVIFGIVFTNLLIALAVTSVQNLERNAEFDKISKQIKAISHLESMLADNWILNCLQKCILGQISVYCRNGRYFRIAPTDPADNSLPTEIKIKFNPLLHTRDCLNKRDMMAQNQIRPVGLPVHSQGLNRNDHFRGSGHSQQSSGRHLADIDEILIELKQKLEGLQRRRIVQQRGNPIFC